nr:acyl-CoA carboxylase subunit beta [Acidimicrobiia bacterium]
MPRPVLRSRLDVRSPEYARNREAMLALLTEFDAEMARVPGVGGDKYVERHRARGKLLVRERIEALVDPDTPFLELMPLAAWGTGDPVGAGTVAGIGLVEGVECAICGTDMTVRGGSANPSTVRKNERAQEIALANRLPLVNLTESA